MSKLLNLTFLSLQTGPHTQECSHIFNEHCFIVFIDFKKISLCSLILNPITCTIILPFNRTMITVKVVSKVISDIVGSCCRSIALLNKILKASSCISVLLSTTSVWTLSFGNVRILWSTKVALTTVLKLSGFK